jgi:hypothetical protein
MEEIGKLIESYTGGFSAPARAAVRAAFAAEPPPDHGLHAHLNLPSLLRHYGPALEGFTWGCYVLLYPVLPVARRARATVPSDTTLPAWVNAVAAADVYVAALEIQSGWLPRELDQMLDNLVAVPGLFLVPTVAKHQMVFQWFCERFATALEELERVVAQPSEADVATTKVFQQRAEQLVYANNWGRRAIKS